MIYFPNAKINLGLDVTARREDGYHNLETVMIPVSGLRDILEIVAVSTDEITLKTSGLAVDCRAEDNLVFRTYKLMQERYKLSGVRIHLHKIIPSGAGLGGGSADSAFTIKAANKQFNLNLSIETMESIAAELGSDTVFFIQNRAQLAQGRGEVLSHSSILDRLRGKRLVIVKPDVHISTAKAYANLTPAKPQVPLIERLNRDITKWSDCVKNDFEPYVVSQHHIVGEIKEKLYGLGAIYASMSGAGSSVYGIFNEPEDKHLHLATTPLYTPICDQLTEQLELLFSEHFVYQQII